MQEESLKSHFRVTGIDFIEIWTGNAKLSAQHFCNALGFTCIAQKRSSQRVSYVVSEGSCRLILTSSLDPLDEEFHTFLKRHGDSVRDLAFQVTSLDTIMQRVRSQSVKVIRPLETFNDSNGELQLAQIVSPDSDLVHTLVDRSKYSTGFLPGFHQGDFLPKVTEWNSKLTNVDHIAVACNIGQAEAHLKWYSDCLNFERFFCSDDEMTEGLEVLGDENDQEGGLRTLVATSSLEKYSFKLVFVEPIDGVRKNQVHEFLERHNGPGVQHIAFHSEDIFHSVKQMKKNKTEFISVPTSYYDTIFTQWKVLYDRRNEMEELGILIDVSEVTEDQPNFILQTFTAPIFDRPTLFTEIISRNGSNGFGRKTIRTLFEAVEKLRSMRDTLVVD